MYNKTINIGIIIAFLCGAAVLWVYNFFTKDEISFKSHSDIYPLIYGEIDDMNQQISKISTRQRTVSQYKDAISSAAEELKTVTLPDPKKISALTEPEITKEASVLIDQIEGVRSKITRPYIPYGSSKEKDPLDQDLYDIYLSIDNQFYWSFAPLWKILDSSAGYTGYRTIKGLSPIEVKSFLTDTSAIKNNIKKLVGVLNVNALNLDQMHKQVVASRDSTQAEIVRLQKSINLIDQSSKDRMMMYVVIPLFGLVVVLLIVIPLLYRQNAEILKSLFEQKIILQIFTVFILVITILLLGIGNKINSETLGTLLGGISVYILQRALGSPDTPAGSTTSAAPAPPAPPQQQ